MKNFRNFQKKKRIISEKFIYKKKIFDFFDKFNIENLQTILT